MHLITKMVVVIRLNPKETLGIPLDLMQQMLWTLRRNRLIRRMIVILPHCSYLRPVALFDLVKFGVDFLADVGV
jgi:hypothetical protein